MADLNAEQIKTLAEVLGPMIEKALRPEFERVRQAIEKNANDLRHDLRAEFEGQITALKDTVARQEARITDLEATRWKVLMSYGAVVGAVTILFHGARMIEWSKFLPFIKKDG